LFGVAEFGHLARASSLCGACKDACPVDIDLPKLLLRVRADGADLRAQEKAPERSEPDARPPVKIHSHVPGGMRLGLRLFGWLASSPASFALAQRLAGVFSRVISPSSDFLRLPAFTGWGYSKDIARPALKPFRDRFDSLAETPAVTALPASQPRPGEQPPARMPAAPLSSSERVQRFSQELVALGGVVTLCTADDLARRLLRNLDDLEISTLQAWDEDYFPAGLFTALSSNGIRLQKNPDPALRAGLTGSLAGIAETGTLVLPGGAGMPQTASLLPEIHFAVLRQADLVDTLVDALRLPVIRQATTAILVSGPSRTADIEMTLTIGVHGPGEVRVFII
jgi:L-lactate dehydrogenase complex protein LldG